MVLDESGGKMDGVLLDICITDTFIGESIGEAGERRARVVVER